MGVVGYGWHRCGTNLLADARPGSEPLDLSSINAVYSRSFTRFKGADYYYSPTSVNSYGLFKTGGTGSNTSLAAKLYNWSTGTLPLGMGVANNHLFGIIGQVNMGSFNIAYSDTMGSKLFVYDGSGEPLIIKHGFFTPGGVYYSNSGPSITLPALNNNIFFFVNTPYQYNGLELWKSDGTVDGTQKVTQMYQGKSFSFANPQGYTKLYNGQIYFAITDGFYYHYLWKTDLTAEGTKLVVSNQVPNEPMEVVNNKLYFVTYTNYSDELWVTDNTDAGTHLVKTGVSMGNVQIKSLTELNNSLYFLTVGSDASSLWKTDGTEAGTVKVKSNVSQLTKGGGKLYYTVNNTIWQFDGTADGTKQLNITGLEGVIALSPVVYTDSKLYVSGYTYKYGRELYVSNIVLPVTMLSFTGQLQGNNSLLQWATVNEQQNSHFNVQRSLHGNDFVSIGKVGAANGSKQNDYSYIDAGITSLGVDKMYYRLQQVDLDGKSTYSKTILVDIPVKSLYIAPNPATSFTAVYSQVNIPGAVIKLADINGKVLYGNKTNLVAGGKTIIPLTGYAKGVYTVIIQSAGTKQEEFKIVIE